MVAWCAHHAPKWNPMNVCSLPPAGGGRDAGAGDRVLVRHRDRRARRRARQRAGRAGAVRRRCSASISFFVNAGIRFVEEICKLRAMTEMWDRIGLRALRRRGPEAAPLPLRRAGQQPRPDRGAAGEQRPADRARDARRHAVQAGTRAQRAAAGVERGARPAAAVGSAVVVADATGARVRDRPARVRRHLRRLDR